MHRRTVLLLILYKEDCKRFRIGPVTPFFSSSVYSELGFCLFLMLWLTEKQISIWKLWFSKKSLEICTSLEIYVAFQCCIYIKRLFKNKHTAKKKKFQKFSFLFPAILSPILLYKGIHYRQFCSKSFRNLLCIHDM